MTKLKIDQVTRTFPARQGSAPTRALEPTDLSVGNNDFVTILGPSGCGKSTLLRIIAGIVTIGLVGLASDLLFKKANQLLFAWSFLR